MTRDEARAAGLKRYQPTKPCTHGHVSERYVGNNYCVECSAQRAAKYAKEHKNEAKTRAARWREANPERHRQNSRNAVARNPQANRDKARAWADANHEKVKARYKKNPAPFKHNAAKRRVRQKQAQLPLTDEQQQWMKEIYEQCPEGYEVDHIYPLRGENSRGLHVPWNLQYLPTDVNRKKRNKLPEEFETDLYDHITR